MRCCGWLAVAVLAGCSSVRIPDEEWQNGTNTLAAAGESVLPTLDAVRFETGVLIDPVRVGSRLHYELSYASADEGADEVWTLDIEVPVERDDEPAYVVRSTERRLIPFGERSNAEHRAETVQAIVVATGPDGRRDESRARVPLPFLRHGIAADCATYHQLAQADQPRATPTLTMSFSKPRPDPAFESFGTTPPTEPLGMHALRNLFAVSGLVSSNATVRGLAMRFGQLPSVWALATRGIDASIDHELLDCEPVETPFGPGWRFPVSLEISGTPTFYATITVVEPRGALQLTAGVVALDGFAPHRPNRPLRVRLVGATAAAAGERAPIVARQRSLVHLDDADDG